MNNFLPPGWRYGETPHIAFIGGFGTTPQGYIEGVKRLAELHPLYDFDILNYSGNGYEGSLTLQKYADILSTVLEEYDTVDTLIGHSLGGAICLQTILDNPNRIKKLVLVNSLGIKINKLNQILWNNIKEPNPEILNNINKLTVQSFAQAYINNPLYYMRTMELCFKVNLEKDLHAMTIPTKIVWSTEDELLPVELGEKLKNTLPNADLVTFKGLHNPFQKGYKDFSAFWGKHIFPFIGAEN